MTAAEHGVKTDVVEWLTAARTIRRPCLGDGTASVGFGGADVSAATASGSGAATAGEPAPRCRRAAALAPPTIPSPRPT